MKNRINSNFDNVVSKLNVFGEVLMIYYAFRPPLDKGFFYTTPHYKSR